MSVSIPQIFCLGVNHNSAPAHIRETLFIPDSQLPSGLKDTKQKFQFAELAALSTCNRFELFGVMPAGRELSDEELLASFAHLQTCGHDSKKTSATFAQYHYLYRNDDAVRHLFTVAASLDSMVVGETQITGQFKDALTLAKDAGTLGSIIDRLGQEALAASKKIRSQTEIGKKSVSVCHSAVDLARRVYADLTQYRIAVLGAGNMARIAAEYMKHLGCRHLTIVNRTIDKGQALSEQVGASKALPLSDLSSVLIETDILIAATQSQEFLITPAMLEKIKKDRAIVLLDISIPRNIDPACNEFEDVFLFDIDDVQKSIDQNLADRKKAVGDALQYIDRGVEQFTLWQSQSALAPMLAAYKKQMLNLVQGQLQKTMAKGDAQGLNEQQKALILGTGSVISEQSTAKLAQILKKLSQHASAEVIKAFDEDLKGGDDD